MTPENKKVKICVRKDVKLYASPENPPNTGTRYTSGTDLLVHQARSGKNYFYLHSWSLWQGSEDSFQLITDEEAKNFLLRKASLGYPAGLDNSDIELIKEYFPDFDEEDA